MTKQKYELAVMPAVMLHSVGDNIIHKAGKEIVFICILYLLPLSLRAKGR
jgi:hypothetical protein